MNWETMVQREAELLHVERSCRAARQQGAGWVDFWSTHVEQITKLVGPVARCPGLRSDRCWKLCLAHLIQTWIDGMSEEPVKLPWDSRPMFEQPTEAT